MLLLTLAVALASCKRQDVSGNQNSAVAPAATGKPSSAPPFQTKEPERYQATRVVTVGGEVEGRTFIARDGERRREEHEEGAGARVAYLYLPGGSYLLLPAKKLYAELKTDAEGVERGPDVPPDFSPEKLLNESRPETAYERLGEESLDGRQVVKYRVTARSPGLAPVETLVWVDERLGMPVRSETTSAGARVTTELRDVREAIDAGLFDVPPDYRKVAPGEIFAQAGSPQ